jgi:hypothetical protein
MKWFVAGTILLFVVGFFACYLDFSGKAKFLVLQRGRIVKVNGEPVRGDVLARRGIAIVTRRDSGNEHSYQLFAEGDADITGDIGSVRDCNQWIAPHWPFLVLIHPCTGSGPGRLMGNGGGLRFTTADKSVIQIN